MNPGFICAWGGWGRTALNCHFGGKNLYFLRFKCYLPKFNSKLFVNLFGFAFSTKIIHRLKPLDLFPATASL